MQIDTVRFGQVEIDEAKLVTFDDGIPGLEDYHKYALLQYEESYPIIWLQSAEDSAICLPVMDTFAVMQGYVFDIDDADVKALDLSGPESLHVVSVLVIPDEIQNMTANLAAPIVINTESGKARQIVLAGSDYNVRVPIFPDICKMVMEKEGDSDVGSVKEVE